MEARKRGSTGQVCFAVRPAHIRMPKAYCPSCIGELDCVTPVGGDSSGPQEGDLSVCIHCAAPLMFDAQLKLNVLTEETMNQLPNSSYIELKTAIRAVRQIKKL